MTTLQNDYLVEQISDTECVPPLVTLYSSAPRHHSFFKPFCRNRPSEK